MVVTRIWLVQQWCVHGEEPMYCQCRLCGHSWSNMYCSVYSIPVSSNCLPFQWVG